MKPVTRAHWALIKRASHENEHVRVFISTSDRGGDEEALIRGADMVEVWQRYLIPMLPPNVRVEFGGLAGTANSPIRRMYEVLGEANDSRSIDTFRVYSDPEDIAARFSLDKQRKYFGDLLKHGQVEFIAIERVDDMDVSATQMRRLLKHGMKDAFVSLLPEGVDGSGIWQTLYLRSLVRE